MQPSNARLPATPPSPPARPFGWPGHLSTALPFWAVILGLGAVVSVMVAWNGTLAAVAVVAAVLVAAVTTFYLQLPKVAMSFLGLCLLGYALFGKGFAYLGVEPLFVGEMSLGVCLLALALRGRPGLLTRSPLLYLLLLNLAIGLSATLPYLSTWGIDAARDAVLWGYGLFALCVGVLLVQYGWVLTALRRYLRFIPLFLVAAPILLLLGKLLGVQAIALPGSGVSLIDLKGGDVAVMLAMIASLLILGLHQLPELSAAGRILGQKREWLWWLLWIATASLSIFRVRAGVVAIGAALLVLVLNRAATRWRKPLIILVLSVGLLAVFNVQIQLGGERNTVSVQTMLVNLQSITSDSGDADRDGSKGWRLRWWHDIVNYTVNGPYFWTGKGYGLNLADADGYQVGYDAGEATLRSPHNGHLNILARSGVPGFVAWLALQLTFATMLVLAYLRARARGQELWIRLNLWTLACWVAFMVNASFDVYLEGPQGGIWFWSFFGFGIALLEVQRRGLTGDQVPGQALTFSSTESSPQDSTADALPVRRLS